MILEYDGLRIIARNFLDDWRNLYGRGRNTEHKLQLASIGASLASDESRKHFAVEVEAREGVRVSPAQAIGQAEVDELLHLCVRRRRVRRPAKGGDSLARLDANEFVPELRAIVLTILRDDERAKGSVDVELCFFIFHAYRIAQRTEKARDFFAIVKVFFGKLARFLNDCLRKCLIIKGLRPAARPGYRKSLIYNNLQREEHHQHAPNDHSCEADERAFYDTDECLCHSVLCHSAVNALVDCLCKRLDVDCEWYFLCHSVLARRTAIARRIFVCEDRGDFVIKVLVCFEVILGDVLTIFISQDKARELQPISVIERILCAEVVFDAVMSDVVFVCAHVRFFQRFRFPCRCYRTGLLHR